MASTGDATGVPDGPAPDGWEEVAPGVRRCRLPGWDETVGSVAGRDAVLLIDAGSAPEDGAALRRAAERAHGLPVRWLALTHPHFDHVLGAAGCGAEVRVCAAAGTADLLAGDGRRALADDAVRHGVPPATAEAAVAALRAPDEEVATALTLDLGGRTVLLAAPGPGHTGHDLVVAVRDAAVVFCGDLVEESGPPQAGTDAHPDRWPAALDRLLALGGDRARYVPGHGAVVDAAFVRAQRAALARDAERAG